jgi:hypothetical protein
LTPAEWLADYSGVVSVTKPLLGVPAPASGAGARSLKNAGGMRYEFELNVPEL